MNLDDRNAGKRASTINSHRSAAADTPERISSALAKIQGVRGEIVRREVLENRRIDILATEVLAYELQPFHRDLMAFQSAVHDFCLQLAPRGFGKSTVLTIARAVFEVLLDPNIRILIASNTQNQAEVFLREIKFHLALNKKLLDLFGVWESEDKWDLREIVVAPRTSSAKESTITCVGVGGAVASRHYDLIIADDLVDEENARTEGQREKVRTWYYKTLGPCLEPHGRMFILGTRYHYLDLYGHLIKNELKDRHQIVRAIAADGSTPWPEKFTLRWLEEKREQMGSTHFASQYQNDTELMKGDIFREEWFRFYETEPDWGSCDTWIACDPAATRADVVVTSRKASSDFWTIVVGSRQRAQGGGYGREIFIRDLWRARCTKQEYLDQLKRMYERYRPLKVLIETVAAQEYLAQDAEKMMPVTRVERSKDKVSRAYWMQPFFENAQVFFPARHLQRNPRDWQALQEELILFPDAEHDDLFDGLQTMVEGSMVSPKRIRCSIIRVQTDHRFPVFRRF